LILRPHLLDFCVEQVVLAFHKFDVFDEFFVFLLEDRVRLLQLSILRLIDFVLLRFLL
jgi:hypothetical protein